MRNILIWIILSLVFLFCCEYNSPFKQYIDRDLISSLDLSDDWIKEDGIILEQTTDITSPEDIVYYLQFENLIKKYSSFEESDTTDLTNFWTPSTDNIPYSNKPDIFEIVKKPDVKTGNGFLHIKLQKNPYPQYVSYRFNTTKDKNYLFRFNYKIISGDGYQLSFGEYDSTNDVVKYEEQINEGLVMIDINSFEDSVSEIRFGYKDVYSNAKALEFYVDDIVLFIVSNANLSIDLCIVYSDEQTDDKTGEEFYEGVYQLKLFARADSSDKITLRLGNRFKEFDLTSGWTQIILESQILKEQGLFTLSIMPTVIDEVRKYPGGVYITKPKLYFLPNKATPD